TLELMKPLYGLLKGIPTAKTLASAYWRKRGRVPEDMDPDRDHCGLLWCAPIVSALGSEVEMLTRLASKIVLDAGFEPLISLTFVPERASACVIAITYDRDQPGEDRQARECYDQLLAELNQRGFYSYRLSILGMTPPSPLLRTLKQALDPNGILAPGRYA